MALSQPATAILHTLAYGAVFSSVPSWWRIQHSLLGKSKYTQAELLVALAELRASKKWRHLVQSLGVTHFDSEKWREVLFLVRLVSRIPWIQSVWVTGSVGAGNARANDDIDFFIITDANRLWICRLLVVVPGLLLGRYRRHDISSHQVRNRWCCNMWLEASHQAIFWANQNLYTARELVQAQPVYVRWDVRAETLLETNPWVKYWSAIGWNFARWRAERHRKTVPSIILSLIRRLPLSWVNELLFRLQFAFLRRHMTTEQVERSVAFFHPRSLHHPVVQQYEKIRGQWNLPPLFP